MGHAVSLDSRASIPDDVIFRELDGEAVLLNLESGIYFGLNEVGTRIWLMLAESRNLAAILAALRDEYDAEDATLERDMRALVDQLESKGLIRIAEE